ncbi:hypothetical protein FVEG_16791 [Fusarium verticillioides 7600]|uniref:Uncharacterized protein n=1 Tax=Gibberella moniliformis (strain M3125 / FGSC 7600) TaxID=334819 RepID=W7MUK5_GIBM7|nr:hypothetical protein FVEG_16791 [Fusarium verticillioides 7600]EWG51424.1 hypothetical protein FVEG_16791 [Fusarium verticillioides 7600]
MNRHFNGPAHGLPLDILNYNGDVIQYRGGTEQWASSARIIQDELFVQRALVIWHPGDLGLQELVDRLYFPICLHISSNTQRHEAGYANSVLGTNQDAGLRNQGSCGSDGCVQVASYNQRESILARLADSPAVYLDQGVVLGGPGADLNQNVKSTMPQKRTTHRVLNF